MKRALLGIATTLGVATMGVGCSTSGGSSPASDAAVDRGLSSGSSSGGSSSGAGDGEPQPVPVGTPCTPLHEGNPSFPGFIAPEVELEPDSPSCGGQFCLIDHFQGLTSCPYGQTADGGPPPGVDSGCVVSGTSTPVRPDSPLPNDAVKPWCADRPPTATVTCSCRCANTAGMTDDDGGPYCTCPSGYSCTPLVPAGFPTSGAYCIKDGTIYEADASCATACNPVTNPCP